ncbi:tRNA-uridine aminocarboxypropyltransferase [Pseudomonas massiliensis]|uniref:tRNA-uridine aminocarboxypropyltransferase n=1 Tax=Pseudomonas massiliensis TaxID=522492 RepID=UPI000590A409|nr:DTW domain-containing protein [Pseudomonas massiliensis]
MSRPRCSRCLRPEGHCLCALIPRLPSRTRVLILQHPSEADHALNTARLAHLGLPNSQLAVTEQVAPALWEAYPGQACVLFPGEGSQLLPAGAEQPMQLIVLDGTWRKARKLLHLNPALAALPRVSLAPVGPSRYRLRKAPGPDALSTVEAIVQALETLEPESSYQELLKPFDALIDGQIAAMGEATYQRNHQGK